MSGVVNTADVYTEAIRYARHENQTVGDKNDLYVIMEQLEAILQKLQRSGV